MKKKEDKSSYEVFQNFSYMREALKKKKKKKAKKKSF